MQVAVQLEEVALQEHRYVHRAFLRPVCSGCAWREPWRASPGDGVSYSLSSQQVPAACGWKPSLPQASSKPGVTLQRENSPLMRLHAPVSEVGFVHSAKDKCGCKSMLWATMAESKCLALGMDASSWGPC